MIQDLLKNPNWYNELDINTILNILLDLGYDREVALTMIKELIK